MIQLKTAFAAVLLTAGVAACGSPQSAPEPENETVAEAMPATPDAAATGSTEGVAPAPDGSTTTPAPEQAPPPAY